MRCRPAGRLSVLARRRLELIDNGAQFANGLVEVAEELGPEFLVRRVAQVDAGTARWPSCRRPVAITIAFDATRRFSWTCT